MIPTAFSTDRTAHYYWSTDLVAIRLLEPDDWRVLHQEQADSEAVRQLDQSMQLPLGAAHVEHTVNRWCERNLIGDESATLTFAIEDPTGEMVGMVNIHSRNNRTGAFSFAVRIFRGSRGRGYAREAMRLVLRYAFHELRYQKANSATIDGNAASMELHRSLGFQVEGRIRRNCYTDGEYRDEILFGLTREEFDEMEASASASS